MKSSKLVEALSTCAPALSAGDAMPVLRHFHINEGVVTASNGVMSISATCDTELRAVPEGELLFKMAQSFDDDEISLTMTKKGNAQIKSGSTKVEIACIPFEAYALPTLADPTNAYPITDSFVEGIRLCRANVGMVAGHVFQMGVIMQEQDGNVALFATDNASLSKYVTDMPVDDMTLPIILPLAFCDALVAQYVAGATDLSIADDDLSLLCGDSVEINTARMEGFIPDLQGAVDSSMPTESPVAIPDGLIRALSRSTLLASRAGDSVSLSATKTGITLCTKTETGRSDETVPLKNAFVCDGLSVPPSLFLRGCKLTGGASILLSNVAVVIAKEGFTHVVAAYGE